MENELTNDSTASSSLQAARVYAMAGLCIVVGLAIGYLLRGPQSPATEKQPMASAGQLSTATGLNPMPGGGRQTNMGGGQPTTPHGAMSGGHMPSLAQMKAMADKQAAPLLEKLKSDPNNSALLVQVGAIYHTTHQFSQAADYYGRAVKADPRNVAYRTKLASSLYRSGDVDGAISQLNQSLSYDPKDANALFDLGMIKLQGKHDGKGALAAWQQLLKANPQLSEERKAAVQKLIAEVAIMQSDQKGIKGAGSNDGRKSNSQ